MRRNQGRRSRSKEQEGNQTLEVIPPEMESDREPEEDSSSEQEAEEDQPEQEVEPEVEQEVQDEADAEQHEPTVGAYYGEYFPEVAIVHVEPQCMMPLACGNHEFKFSMSRVEVQPDNFVLAVKLLADEDERLGRLCNYHDEYHCCQCSCPENPN